MPPGRWVAHNHRVALIGNTMRAHPAACTRNPSPFQSYAKKWLLIGLALTRDGWEQNRFDALLRKIIELYKSSMLTSL